jgi:hypothetical protein
MTQDLVDVRAGVIAELSASDLVGPIEKLRAATVDVLEHVQAIDPVGEPDNRIAEMRVKVEPYLALVLPLADHGGERGLEAVLAAVAMFATEEGESSDRPNAEPLLAMALHDLVWTLAAYALTYDRTDIPVSLAEVTIPSRYAGEEVGVFCAVALRHNELHDRNAFKVFESFRSWLVGSQLRGTVSHWKREVDFDAAIEEAELWAALKFANEREDTVWTPLVGSDVRATRSLRSRFLNSRMRSDLSELLGADADHAVDALNRSYANLVGVDNRRFRDQLIVQDDS